MWKSFAAVLFAISMFAGTASARGGAGGGGAGGMGGSMGAAGTNYGQSTLGNDVQPSKPTHRAKTVSHKHKHVAAH